MMKTRQDNDVIDCIGVVFAETETELLRTIESSAVCDENKIEQKHDQSYRCNLHKKMIPNYHDWLDWVSYMVKIR